MIRLFTRSAGLLVLTVTLAGSTDAVPLRQSPPPPPQIVEITAERFSFTPSEFHVSAAQSVEIRLRSDDTDHGFRIVGADVNVVIPKRSKGLATVTFQPPSAGRYVFECSKLCGAGHAYMRGTIIAE